MNRYNSHRLATTPEHFAAFGLALLMTLATVGSMAHLAVDYQADARLAAQQSAPTAQKIVVIGRRGVAG